MVFWFSDILQKNSHPFIDIFMTFKKLKIWKHSMKDWSLQKDTMVLWSNSSFIRLEGWGFRSRRCQNSFSIQINKSRKSEQKKKGTLALIASVRAVAVREEEETRRERARSGDIIPSINLIWWRYLTVFV